MESNKIEMNQNKFIFWAGTISSLFVLIGFNIIIIFLFKSILLYILIVIPMVIFMFPLFFRHPKRIILSGKQLFIETKLKKYEFKLDEIKKIKNAYTRVGDAYKIKAKEFSLSFYLDSSSFGIEELTKFIKIIKERID